MKRRKSETEYWNKSIKDMFSADPDTMLVKNRYRAIRYLLKGRYSNQTFENKDMTIEMLKDAIFLDRRLRQHTEKIEQPLKEILSQEEQIELGYRI